MVIKLMRIALLVIAAIAIWGYFATRKANKAVDAANALADEGNAALQGVGDLVKELFGDEIANSFPKDRAKYEKSAELLRTKLATAAEKFRAAAAKFDEAIKTDSSKIFSEYLALKAKSFVKMADSKDAFQKAAVLVLDKSIETAAQFREKRDALVAEANKLDDESTAFATQADKIHDEHKSEFESK